MKYKRAYPGDLHMGTKDAKSDFNAGPFWPFMMWLYRQGVRELVLSETMELWQNSLAVVLAHNAELYERLSDLFTLTMVAGNHEWPILAFKKLPYLNVKPVEEILFDDGVYCQHGHQYDLFNAPDAVWGERITRLVGMLEQKVHPDIDEKLLKLEDGWQKVWRKFRRMVKYKTPARYAGELTGHYERGAVKILKRPEVKVVIFWHTHQPMMVKHENGLLYINTGSWVGNATDFVLQDGNHFQLCKWQGGTTVVFEEAEI